MTAFLLSAVITRGLDTTLPRLSDSSADSSMFTRLPLPRLRIDRPIEPAAPATGRFTVSCSGCAPMGSDAPAPLYTSEDAPRETGLLVSGLTVSFKVPDTPTLYLLVLNADWVPKRAPSWRPHRSS